MKRPSRPSKAGKNPASSPVNSPTSGKLRLRQSDSKTNGSKGSASDSAAAAAPRPYFEVYPAQLPQHLDRLRALTKAGVRGAPGLDAAQALLATTLLRERVRGEVLDLTALGGLLSSLPNVTLRPVEGSAAALSALSAAGLSGAAVPGEPLPRARTVTLILAGDRGNNYIQAQLAWAHACTEVGGTLYLAGDKDKGFDRYVRQASTLFGAGETINRDGGMRVAKLIRRPGPTPPLPAAEQYEYAGVTVVGLPGVFSAAKIDKATRILLEVLGGLNMQGQQVLDIGCGAGIIGAWTAKRGAAVTLLDADLQSVRSAELTLQANQLTGAVLHSDVDSALTDQTFDLILSNPPFHVGRGMALDVAAEFLNAIQRRLRVGGSAYIVANDFLPYEKLLAWATVTEVVRESGFKVLKMVKKAKEN